MARTADENALWDYYDEMPDQNKKLSTLVWYSPKCAPNVYYFAFNGAIDLKYYVHIGIGHLGQYESELWI